MDVTETLDAMRADVPGCSLIAFTDLGTRLVLSSSAAAKPAQEDLDQLSSMAQTLLQGTLSEGAASLLETGEGDTRAGVAFLLSISDAKIFLRAAGESPEALVCVCAPDADLEKVVDCGRSTLARIVAKN